MLTGLLKISDISFKCIKHQRLLWGQCWYVSGHSKLSTRMKEESDSSFCKKMHSLVSPSGAVQAEPQWEPLLQPSSFLFPSAAPATQALDLSCHIPSTVKKRRPPARPARSPLAPSPSAQLHTSIPYSCHYALRRNETLWTNVKAN